MVSTLCEKAPARAETYIEDNSVIFHLLVTARCNASCKYCINRIITFNEHLPQSNKDFDTEPERDTRFVLEVARKYPDRIITVCFYGGEPLLAGEKMIQIMKILDNSDRPHQFRYMVYTNSTLLREVFESYPSFMKKVWLYSISIDGDQEQHDMVRPGSDHSRVLKSLEFLKDNYKGNVLFWSTLREEQSLLRCFREFMRMYEQDLADHFYWHWLETSEPFVDLAAYSRQYSCDMKTVMDDYVENLRSGRLLPIAHINELVLFIVTGRKRNHTPCCVELQKNFDLIAGEYVYCVDLPVSLKNSKPCNGKDLTPDGMVAYKAELGCSGCPVHYYCGGRCPVQAMFGSMERTRQYCSLMRIHVQCVEERINEIEQTLRENRISLQYVYDHSAFITRYTDVTP